MKKDYLLTPGPTPVPPQALLAMAKPMIHHRTPQFMEFLKEATQNLKYVLQTNYDVFIFASSGTGAMDASVCNLLSSGDKALVVNTGKFGERFKEICAAYGVESICLDVVYGEAVSPKLIEDTLAKHKDIKAVYTTLCETSTGVINDIKAIGEVVEKTPAVLIVDTISGLGACEFKMDEWSVDVAVCGSQKGLMLPPGLAFIGISPKAWKLVEQSKLPKYYFDFKQAKKALDKNDTPFTPAVSLVIGLCETLKIIKQEGLENVWKRHERLANAMRQAVKALGLELFAKSASSNAVTAVKAPQGIDSENVVKLLRDKYGVWIAGGQAHMKGKVFRIAHMGYMTEPDILVAISALEMVLVEIGYKCEQGAGVKAAEEALKQ
ncbi:MAG: alanine--glyoxylate aminotransferase family protein [Candidatus Omnitrophota bacterium]